MIQINMNTPATLDSVEDRALARLVESSLFQTYRSAFKLATGFTIELINASDEKACGQPAGDNSFCEQINKGGGCESCRRTHESLLESSGSRARAVECFAGFKEAAVPVRCGDEAVGFLRLGQIIEGSPNEDAFESVAEELKGSHSAAELKKLRTAHGQTPVMESERFVGCVTLLSAFALQLSEEISRIAIEDASSEPEAVSRAKQYVNAHLEDRITLEAVANHVHVSQFYFCKIFKQATGMTLTEFVNRRRVAWAKRKLLDPRARVTEIAYDVGYQSLSQFNRSFLRYAGESPTSFRTRGGTTEALRPAAA
ncbi:MAG: AraC-like DNA-binding protein/ligand-binding sensor protein [Verrucomicrobiales bacterium]|jgi:AraC-like DNA-binding protein/ligand-binding sensor protein